MINDFQKQIYQREMGTEVRNRLLGILDSSATAPTPEKFGEAIDALLQDYELVRKEGYDEGFDDGTRHAEETAYDNGFEAGKQSVKTEVEK